MHALVTGASGGIGLEIATCLARDRHDLVLVARSSDALETLAQTLRSRHGVDVRVIAADLSEPHGADRLFEAVRQAGCDIDVLVNNAGFGLFGKHVDTDLSGEQRMIDLNITALTRLTKLFLAQMVARGDGKIMNVASTAAFQPGPYMAVYYATKAYVLSYSEAINEELRGTGVSVTALCPGPTASGFQQQAAMEDSALVKGRQLPGAAEVAAFGVRAMNRRQAVAVHGTANALMVQSLRLAPRAAVTRLVSMLSRPV